MFCVGMVTTQTDTSAASKRLHPKFTAAWIVAAAHHGVREARIARQPILLLSASLALCHRQGR